MEIRIENKDTRKHTRHLKSSLLEDADY